MALYILIISFVLIFCIMLYLLIYGILWYEIEWRYICWKTHETEHDWGDWMMVDCGGRQIRFCKNCGKMDKR